MRCKRKLFTKIEAIINDNLAQTPVTKGGETLSTIDDKLNYLINREQFGGRLSARYTSFPSGDATIIIPTNYRYNTLNVHAVVSAITSGSYAGTVYISKIDENDVETAIWSQTTVGTYDRTFDISDAFKIKIQAQQRQSSTSTVSYTLS